MPRFTPAMEAAAVALLADGASYRDAAATVGIGRTALQRHIPGDGWTYRQAGRHTAILRATSRRIERAYTTKSGGLDA